VDELMMNLFTLIANQVRDRRELFDEEGRIVQKLVSVGYGLLEADAALTLMQELVRTQDDTFFCDDSSDAMRTMSSEERSRFTIDAFSFAVKLGHLGVISGDQREDIIEKAMNLYSGRIEISHMKLLVAHLLVAGVRQQHDQEAPFSTRRSTAWN
jgi:uncharacterized protein Smg (DUF494 family)